MSASDNTARSTNMFGNFDIVKTIGQGGMGIVYRAHDISLGRVVALKVLKDELRSMPKVVARFQREAEAIASLDHPNIVQVYTVGAIGGIPYFAMEFIDGKPLSRILRRHKSIPWRDALKIARDAAEGLAAAHDAQIIHRDIKPGNILVDRQGQAYVTDFGIAKVLSADTQLTVDGSKLGTPQYMSPERCHNQEVTPSSDIYSLGVVLFQLISGHLPYSAQDPVELIRKIIVDPPRRLSRYVPDIPAEVERLVAYMIEKKPEHRPADAHEVSDLITRVLDGKPLFESDSGLDGALDELREDLPTPSTGLDNDRSEMALPARALLGIGDTLRGIPLWMRWSAVALVAMLVAYGVGAVVATQINRGYALDLVDDYRVDARAWHESATIASFFSEGPGVLVGTVRLDRADIEWMVSLGPPNTFANLVKPSGQATACWLNAEDRRARLVELPESVSRATQVAALRDPNAAGGWILVYDGADKRLHAQAFDEDLTPVGTVSPIAEVAGTVRALRTDIAQRSLLVASEANGRHTLYLVNPVGQDFAAILLNSSTEPHEKLQFDAKGAAVWQQGATVFSALLDAPHTVTSTQIGDAELVGAAYDVTSGSPILMRGRTGSGSSITGVNALGEAAAFTIDGAIDAAWLPRGSVGYLAHDSRGDLQFWTTDPAVANSQNQRTFVDGGVVPPAVLSFDGAHVVLEVAKGFDPSFLFIQP